MNENARSSSETAQLSPVPPPEKTISDGTQSRALVSFVDEQGTIRPLEELEAEAIRFAVEHCAGCMSEAARRLRIGRSTLYRKLTALRIAPPPSNVRPALHWGDTASEIAARTTHTTLQEGDSTTKSA